ncbi:unnamed protein product [Ceutorhynchus assimilis]|uniref:Regulatory protein zeste n=1 Tax=Ceutorhynchus assimilis TaxID=467358 RepID=A0A9N9QRN7_9CUCU|nr:unnamed protein product [Ceutorhynchus assimilis]
MDSTSTSAKRVRTSNFLQNGKSHLIDIISKYKSIIENKETNKNTNTEKNAAWDRITAEFNASSTAELRKKAADAKLDQKKTGGGLPPSRPDEAFDDVLLSIINKKTVFGLETPYGGDVSSGDEAEPSEQPRNDIEIVYEYAQDRESMDEDVMPSTWKKYTATDLKKPLSSALRTEGQKENNGLSMNYCGKIPFENISMVGELTSTSQNFAKMSLSHFDIPSRQKEQEGSTGKETHEQVTPNKNRLNRSTPASNHRRPTVQVKALTSSEVSEKYNQLMDMRLEIADFTKKRLAQELDHSKDKHKKEMELLDLQVLVEKERLNKLKRPDY